MRPAAGRRVPPGTKIARGIAVIAPPEGLLVGPQAVVRAVVPYAGVQDDDLAQIMEHNVDHPVLEFLPVGLSKLDLFAAGQPAPHLHPAMGIPGETRDNRAELPEYAAVTLLHDVDLFPGGILYPHFIRGKAPGSGGAQPAAPRLIL
ncbi:hypothetical protein CENSYa_1693 [Cenarchaeum symbiosum A]|uniref:Uncharacterized protein n=1 Tax=Cenarchaeum symbiosum (strain A) TaxID=414004 RepID=A0RY92_CENSY|nr:hypothetical protein CENSYa_1693 [Cenarchaeum symbiosum A]